MKKKQLSNLLDQLSARLEQASSDNKNLQLENKSLQEKCEKLTQEAKTLAEQVKELLAKLEDAKKETIPQIKEVLPVASPIENLEKRVTAQVRLSEETEYAASVIGKIVVCATEHCNYLSAQPIVNSKELVNLILGKTEVLKAEILNIAYSEADFITKKALIDNCFDTAKDYFASVKAQI